MTQDLLTIIKFWFDQSFAFWSSFNIPGTNVTPAGMLLFIVSAYIGIKFIKGLFSGDNND